MEKSKLILFIAFAISVLIFISCSNEEGNYNFSNEHMLELAQYYGLHHLQSPKEIDVLGKNKIKTLSIIHENISTGELDSLTFLRFDDLGRITSKTTDECTTVGCLPYTIVQLFKYENGRIVKMEDYTFKKKYKTKLKYWQMQDTSKLSLFDWEDYVYSGDTLYIESGSQKWELLKDISGNIIEKKLIAKFTNQILIINFDYQSDRINSVHKANLNPKTSHTIFNVISSNQVERVNSDNPEKISKSIYFFNEMGLIDEIKIYTNDELKGRLKFIYK